MRIAGFRLLVFVVVCISISSMSSQAQNRGVYPLGMTATNSGVTPTRALPTLTNSCTTPAITPKMRPAIRYRSPAKTLS